MRKKQAERLGYEFYFFFFFLFLLFIIGLVGRESTAVVLYGGD